MLVTADIGGTKTTLAAFSSPRPEDLVRLETHPSAGVADFGALLADFVARGGWRIDAAGLGVAGPVLGTHVETTNLPWALDAPALSARLSGVPVVLLNDLEALA